MSRGTAAADLESARQNRRIFREAARGTLRFCNQVFDLGAEFAVGAKLCSRLRGGSDDLGSMVARRARVSCRIGHAGGRTTAVTGWAREDRVGQVVFEADSLRTGPDGTIGITLKDDTRLALGPASEVRLERFAYAPGDANLGMVLKFVRGVTAYVSGRLAKLAPDSIRLETPSAIVGVRGTTLAIRVEP
jgi:hypothetical protein